LSLEVHDTWRQTRWNGAGANLTYLQDGLSVFPHGFHRYRYIRLGFPLGCILRCLPQSVLACCRSFLCRVDALLVDILYVGDYRFEEETGYPGRSLIREKSQPYKTGEMTHNHQHVPQFPKIFQVHQYAFCESRGKDRSAGHLFGKGYFRLAQSAFPGYSIVCSFQLYVENLVVFVEEGNRPVLPVVAVDVLLRTNPRGEAGCVSDSARVQMANDDFMF